MTDAGIPGGSSRPAIEADFEVIRVQTMSSNAIRVTLEMPEHMINQMAMFAECQRQGVYLHGVFTAKANEDGPGTGKGRKLHI